LAGPSRIVSLEPTNLRQILDNILTVGEVAGREEQARAVTLSLQERIAQVAAVASPVTSRPRVFCMERMDPPMAGGHWVPEMIRLAGGIDGVGHEGAPSTVIPWEERWLSDQNDSFAAWELSGRAKYEPRNGSKFLRRRLPPGKCTCVPSRD